MIYVLVTWCNHSGISQGHSERPPSTVHPFIGSLNTFLHARRVLDIGDGAINKAALAHKEFTPHARVYT